ncbi:MAG: AAA family ATPase [candidate division WOR-3 bacterium]|nr:AAA family ATPase [candidate division WOR-3 bacterium]
MSIEQLMWVEKYRPKRLDDVVNQKEIVEGIKRIIASPAGMPNMLFAGPAGVGKTTVALCIAREVLGEYWRDYTLELNASDERGINMVREKVKMFTRYTSIGSIPFKIVILDEADEMTPEAQNALLKILEEPQLNTIFLLTTDVPENLFATVRSRCHLIRFADISENEIKRWLENRLKPSQFPLSLIASLAQGSLGKAYAIATSPDDYFTPAIVQFLSRIPTGAAHTATQDTILLNTADSLIAEKVPLNTAINTAIFLLRNALRAQLGYSHIGPEIPPSLMQLRPQEILAKLQFLSARLKETHLNTNATLTIFSLLYHLMAKDK